MFYFADETFQEYHFCLQKLLFCVSVNFIIPFAPKMSSKFIWATSSGQRLVAEGRQLTFDVKLFTQVTIMHIVAILFCVILGTWQLVGWFSESHHLVPQNCTQVG